MIKRSIQLSLFTLVISVLIYLVSGEAWKNLSAKQSLPMQTETLLSDDFSGLSADVVQTVTPDKQTQLEAALAPYRDKLTDLFAQTLHNGDLAQYKNMSYDEDWCIAYSDLREEDLAIYQQERDEWLLSRGYAPIWDPQSPALQQDDPRFYPERNQHLIPYEEMPHDELTEQAFNNDFLALIVLNQRPDTHWKEKDKIASRLVFMGDTTFGLSSFVSKSIYSGVNRIKDGETAQAYELVYKALAFAEYGLIRGDDYSMGMLIQAVEGLEDTPESRKLKEIMASVSSDKIKQSALQFMENLNTSRAEHNFPSLEAGASSKAAQAHQLSMYSDTELSPQINPTDQ